MLHILTGILAMAALLTVAPRARGAQVFVEAESFADLGGWVVDQQSMDNPQMGSSYLLAHGLGVPVADASTTVAFPATGEYRVFVRTCDWVAPHPGSPGKFQVLIDGTPLAETFGVQGDGKWYWQPGGTVTIASARVKLALHDLTGFEGRCDALLFTQDAAFTPPNDPAALAAFRRQALNLPDLPQVADAGKQYDLVVIGGGFAGCCAAVSAARLGLSVALIHDRPVVGGNSSSEVRVHEEGNTGVGPFPQNADIVKELASGARGNAEPGDHYADDQKMAIVRSAKGLDLRLNQHAFAVEKDGNKITAVLARDIRTGQETRYRGTLFADCTGDGTIGYLAGADYRVGRESKAETGEALAPDQPDLAHMGMSNMWYALDTKQITSFPACPWAIAVTKGKGVAKADWDWEAGFKLDGIADTEAIRDYNFRAAYGTWDYTKNRAPDKEKYATWKLSWLAYISGKRESRRLLGDHILTQQDVLEQKEYPDAVVTTTWSIDLHYPVSPEQDYRAIAKQLKIEPYTFPYRCLYSRNLANLFMAGRNISVTHVALGTVRVQKTTGMMGVVVGRAAYLCKKHNVPPRGVYERYLNEFKRLLANPERP